MADYLPRTSLAPAARQTRTKFTTEDDEFLLERIHRAQGAGEYLGGMKLYKEIAKAVCASFSTAKLILNDINQNPRHTHQSWHSRWNKTLRKDVISTNTVKTEGTAMLHLRDHCSQPRNDGRSTYTRRPVLHNGFDAFSGGSDAILQRHHSLQGRVLQEDIWGFAEEEASDSDGSSLHDEDVTPVSDSQGGCLIEVSLSIMPISTSVD